MFLNRTFFINVSKNTCVLRPSNVWTLVSVMDMIVQISVCSRSRQDVRRRSCSTSLSPKAPPEIIRSRKLVEARPVPRFALKTKVVKLAVINEPG